MKRYHFAIYDVGIDAELHCPKRVARLLPTLHALPRGRADSLNWKLSLRQVSRLPPHSAPPISSTLLHVYPGFDVSCWRDPAGLFLAATERGQARVDFACKQAALDFLPGAEEDAERLGRLVLLELLRFEERYLMHAGAVQVAGGAVLVCGSSGAGKSTLVTVWSALGHARFMSEDRCVLFRSGQVLMTSGISDNLALSDHSRKLLESHGIQFPEPRTTRDNKGHYDCHRVFLSVCHDPYPIKAVVIKTQQATPGALFERCDPGQAGELIMNSSLFVGSPEIMRAHFEILLELATQVPCYCVPHQVDCREFAHQMTAALRSMQSVAVGVPLLDQRRSLPLPQDETEANGPLLCRTLLEPHEQDGHALRDPSRLFALLKLADHHGALPVMAANLQAKSVALKLPANLADSLAFSLLEAAMARQAYLGAAEAAAIALRHQAIPCALLDGLSVAERCYHPPEVRLYDALDFLVDPGQGREAVRVLQELGFVAAENLSGGCPSATQVTILQNLATQCRLRIHTVCPTPSHHGQDQNKRTRVLLDRRVTIFTGAAELPVISAADQLLLSGTRPILHPLWNRLINLLDVILLQGRLSDEELREVDREAERWGCLGNFRLCLNRSFELFSHSQAITRMEEFKPPLVTRLWHGLLNPHKVSMLPWGKTHLLRLRLMRRLFAGDSL